MLILAIVVHQKKKIARRQEKGVRSSYLILVYANFGIGVALGIGNAQCIAMHIKGAPGGMWGHLMGYMDL